MHDGRFKKLAAVMNHYQNGMKKGDQRLPKNNTLSSKDKVDLVAFLLTLSDTAFIHNKQHQFPINNFKTQNQ
jgi:cytochrome c peroxidase